MPKFNKDKLGEFRKTIPETPFEKVSSEGRENKGTLPVVYVGGKDYGLDDKTEKEASVEDIAEILKNNKIDQIIIAGEKQKNKEEQTLRLHPDLDSELALYLLNNFNKRKPEEMYNDGAVVSVINKDGTGKELIEDKKGVKIYIDTGGNWLKIEKEGETTTLHIDHHGVGQRAPTSGIKMIAEIMEKAGILKEKPEWLNKLIDFVNDVDNLTYLDKKDKKGNKVFTESYFRNEWPGSLYALAEKKIPLKLLMELCEKGIIKDLTKPLTDEELNGEIGKIKVGEHTIKDICIEQRKEVSNTLDVGVKNSIKNNKEEGLDLENTRLGRVIYHNYFKIRGAANKILDHLAFKATIAKGYDTYVAYNNNKKKKSFFINSKNPNLSIVVEELNKKYPGCAIDIRGVMVYGKIVDGMTEEDFLNIIDPKILEKSTKMFRKEKQGDDKGVATPEDTEPAITPEAGSAEYEAEKAEIEKKRKEELKRLSFDELMSEFEHNNHRLIGIRDEIGNSTFRIIDVSEEEQEVIIDYIKPDGTHSNFGLKIGSEETFKKYKEKYAEIEWSDEDIEAKYDAELAELDNKYNKNQETTSKEDSDEDDTENNTENSLLLNEKIREYKALIEEDREADIKLAELLEMISQLPDDEEGENEEPQKTEGAGNDEEQNEKAIETTETKINETEKDQTYKKITKEDFSWSFPNYINSFGKFELGNKLSITVEEFTHEQVKRKTLGRILNSSLYKTIKLEKPFCELKIIQEGSTKIYKLDNISQAMDKADEVLSEYARKTASDLGEVTYIPYDYVKGSEKIENNIRYFINENILSAINKDREEKPFLYFAVERSNNSDILNITKNENTGALDLRKIGGDWVGLERKHLVTTAENEGFFEYNIFGLAKIIKNIKEIKNGNNVAAKSDQAIYKIVGPNEEIIADNIQGYDEATKIYWEKTSEYQKVVEEEFKNLNNNKK